MAIFLRRKKIFQARNSAWTRNLVQSSELKAAFLDTPTTSRSWWKDTFRNWRRLSRKARSSWKTANRFRTGDRVVSTIVGRHECQPRVRNETRRPRDETRRDETRRVLARLVLVFGKWSSRVSSRLIFFENFGLVLFGLRLTETSRDAETSRLETVRHLVLRHQDVSCLPLSAD